MPVHGMGDVLRSGGTPDEAFSARNSLHLKQAQAPIVAGRSVSASGLLARSAGQPYLAISCGAESSHACVASFGQSSADLFRSSSNPLNVSKLSAWKIPKTGSLRLHKSTPASRTYKIAENTVKRQTSDVLLHKRLDDHVRHV